MSSYSRLVSYCSARLYNGIFGYINAMFPVYPALDETEEAKM